MLILLRSTKQFYISQLSPSEIIDGVCAVKLCLKAKDIILIESLAFNWLHPPIAFF